MTVISIFHIIAFNTTIIFGGSAVKPTSTIANLIVEFFFLQREKPALITSKADDVPLLHKFSLISFVTFRLAL